MKLINQPSLRFSILIICSLFFTTASTYAQEKRIKPPKRHCAIKSVDLFVDHSFDLYNKVFVYDSLSQQGVEIPEEYQQLIMEDMQRNLDSMYVALPVVIEDMGGKSFIAQTKGTLNLNKARRAITSSIKTVKKYSLGEPVVSED